MLCGRHAVDERATSNNITQLGRSWQRAPPPSMPAWGRCPLRPSNDFSSVAVTSSAVRLPGRQRDDAQQLHPDRRATSMRRRRRAYDAAGRALNAGSNVLTLSSGGNFTTPGALTGGNVGLGHGRAPPAPTSPRPAGSPGTAGASPRPLATSTRVVGPRPASGTGSVTLNSAGNGFNTLSLSGRGSHHPAISTIWSLARPMSPATRACSSAAPAA